MILDANMRKLMAYLYATPKFKLYEFAFDKRDNLFKATIYLTDEQYWTCIFQKDTDKVLVSEWHTNQSAWYPGNRVTYINKYLKKYKKQDRNSIFRWYTFAEVDLDILIKALDKMSEPDIRVDISNRQWANPARKGGVYW